MILPGVGSVQDTAMFGSMQWPGSAGARKLLPLQVLSFVCLVQRTATELYSTGRRGGGGDVQRLRIRAVVDVLTGYAILSGVWTSNRSLGRLGSLGKRGGSRAVVSAVIHSSLWCRGTYYEHFLSQPG